MPNENYAITPLPVVVFADLICPYSYIALDQMDDLLRDYNVELLWRPHCCIPRFRLRARLCPPQPPKIIARERGLGSKRWRRIGARNAISRQTPIQPVRLRSSRICPGPRPRLAFKTAVFEALWLEGRDIAQLSTLQAAADKVGLDG